MGTLYENLVTYTAFAVGGKDVTSTCDTQDGTVTLQLQVIKGGAVVKAWFLNKPLPVNELLPYCTAVDATARTAAPGAVELPSDAFAELRGDAVAKPGTTFRLARAELAKDGSCKSVFYPTTFDSDVEQAVRDTLVSADFSMVPYKLSVCGAGGAVKPHVDTPTLHSARMVGKVVVALPSAFRGGALDVHAPSSTAPTLAAVAGGRAAAAAGGGGGGGVAAAPAAGGAGTGSAAAEDGAAVCTFNWAARSSSTKALQWAAYFGDCVHEVKPVTAGHRVTVTFAIVLTDGTAGAGTNTVSRRDSWEKPVELSVVASSPSISALRLARFVDHAATCPVATFGILVTEKYTFTGIVPDSLKGMDRVVYNALARAGLRVALRPVVYSMYITTPSIVNYDNDEVADATNVVYAFDAAEVARICAATKGDLQPTDTPFVLCSAATHGRLRGDEPVGVCLHHRYANEDEDTAAEDHKLFFAVALMVTK